MGRRTTLTMKKALLTGVAVLFLATGTAHADEKRLPKEFWGKWCVDATAAGESNKIARWMHYTHKECDDPERSHIYSDMIIGPHIIDGCKDFSYVVRREKNGNIYYITYSCYGSTTEYKIWLDEEGLNVQ
jgi:hypothetical protein